VLFNSLDFIIFAVIFFTLWPLLRNRDNIRWGYITLASFIFYGWWDWRFLFLIIGCGIFNYGCGEIIARNMRTGKTKKIVITLSIIGNLSILGIFKYLDFSVHNLNWLLNCFGYAHEIPLPSLILPVGISFYTFQAMSYTLDIAKGELKPARNFLHFMAYLSCFPQLVAGPIVRASDFMPQLEQPGKADDSDRYEGLKLIIFGYFKKCVIADNLAPMVNAAFQSSSCRHDSLYWWIIMLGFTLQIFGDFSGYSDIARGLARWMGYHFNINFNNPYTAVSFSDFWRRWHISLSTWFRDYVYIPLGGNRCSKWRSNWNIFLTMLASGLWHGSNWTFIAWGAGHGLLMILERLLHLPQRWYEKYWSKLFSRLIVFFFVVIAWVFFRSETFAQAGSIVTVMLTTSPKTIPATALYGKAELVLILCLTVIVYLWLEPKTLALFRKKIYGLTEVPLFLFLALVAIFFRGVGGAFIYFQF